MTDRFQVDFEDLVDRLNIAEVLLESRRGPTNEEALDALKEELKTQRERDPYWRFKQGHKFKTAWAEEWPGGIVDRSTCR